MGAQECIVFRAACVGLGHLALGRREAARCVKVAHEQRVHDVLLQLQPPLAKSACGGRATAPFLHQAR